MNKKSENVQKAKMKTKSIIVSENKIDEEEGGCYWYLDLESHRSDVGVTGAGVATSHRNRFPMWVTVWDLCNLCLHLYGGDDNHLTNPKSSPRKAQDLRRHAHPILQIYLGLTLETPKPSLLASDLRLYDPSIWKPFDLKNPPI
ncbi:unnamed protein product [Lactuca saligna]|uniref:Uncharacterized protein n=1 Tax=Lactuca saligna TaxID=75948 RepID=A0AA35V863_LACSI|nr:unnamed protein product [Lactuca saligna]